MVVKCQPRILAGPSHNLRPSERLPEAPAPAFWLGLIPAQMGMFFDTPTTCNLRFENEIVHYHSGCKQSQWGSTSVPTGQLVGAELRYSPQKYTLARQCHHVFKRVIVGDWGCSSMGQDPSTPWFFTSKTLGEWPKKCHITSGIWLYYNYVYIYMSPHGYPHDPISCCFAHERSPHAGAGSLLAFQWVPLGCWA